MSKMSVFDRGWIDLVFEGRNKAYGAYQLRKDDGKTTMKAFFSGLGFMGLVVGLPFMLNSFKSAPELAKGSEKVIEVSPEILPLEPLKPLEPPKPEPASPAPKNPNQTIRHTVLVASSQPVNEPIANTDQLQRTEISSVTSEGDGREIIIGPSSLTGTPEGTGTAVTSTTGTGPETIETFVDEMPEYPGGINKFRKEVGNRFRTPVIEDSKTKQMTVYVTFVIELDGSLTNIKVGRDPGYNLAAEAERVLKSMKVKWKPGVKKGKAVRTAYGLPITINLQ